MTDCYFAFGSNMDKERMKKRKANFTEMQKGIIKDWKLVFNKINNKKVGAGYANIIPNSGSIVEGIIYKVDNDAIPILDGFEGVPNHYQKVTMSVENTDKELIDCIVYIANPSKVDNFLKPEKWYLQHLLKGKEFLSESYFSDLKSIETLD
jgi:gamma-glutamylcyclotransferase (GGCT)/AIG2-like uncharacterized protein YtfP